LNKIKLTGLIFLLLFFIPVMGFAKDESIIGLSDHELGDQTLSINAGLFVPLPFLDGNGTSFPPNQSLGGAGALQWNAYLNAFFRLGLEIGISFTFGPNVTTLLMVPFTLKATWVLNYDRFEFPLSLGVGADIIKFGSGDILNVALIAKPGVAAYYRYDSNLSFGLNVAWWWNLEFPTPDNPLAIMANSLEIAPALFYHF